ncbi:BglG family transcription antiterminator [Stomatohabitans albus]|uniref:BglG family transcription antiterminator n=1 Tax=Stomatohabitans albus TaxID=3110766 RepID=UPI00300CE4D1
MARGRASQLVHYLETRFSAPSQALMQRLDISERSLRDLIKTVNSQLEGAGRISHERGRIRLDIHDPARFRTLHERFEQDDRSLNEPEKRQAVQFAYLSNAHGPVTIDDLAAVTQVSRSTALQDLSVLRAQLEPFSIELIGKPNRGIELVGDELHIRFFYLEHAKSEIPTDMLNMGIIALLNQEIERHNLGQGVRNLLDPWLNLMLVRVRDGYPLNAIDRTYNNLRHSARFEMAEALVNAAGRRHAMVIPEAESYFIAIPLAGLRTTMDVAQPQDTHHSSLADEILAVISAELNITLSHPTLLDSFARHMDAMVNRMRYRVYVDEWDIPEMAYDHPLAFEMAQIARRVIHDQHGIEVIDAEVGLLATWFGVFIEEQRLLYEQPVRVGICTPRGAIAARLIRARLMKELGTDAVFSIYDCHDPNQITADAVDVLLHTDPITVPRGVATITIGMGFDPNELALRIRRHRLDRTGQSLYAAGAASLVCALMGPNQFFLLPPDSTHEDQIAFIADKLEASGVVDDGFKQRLLDGEYASTFQTASEVSFPHTMVTTDQLVLAVGVCAHPEPGAGARIMVVLGIPSGDVPDEGVLIDVYEEVIRLSSSPEDVKALSQLTSAAAFLQYAASNHVFSERVE